MRPIKDRNLAQLLMQLRFAPQRQRRKQLDAAEKLYALIDKDKEYPFEFVCFRITGYHPKGLAGQPLIKGDQLAEDLGIFITKLSVRSPVLSPSNTKKFIPSRSLPTPSAFQQKQSTAGENEACSHSNSSLKTAKNASAFFNRQSISSLRKTRTLLLKQRVLRD